MKSSISSGRLPTVGRDWADSCSDVCVWVCVLYVCGLLCVCVLYVCGLMRDGCVCIIYVYGLMCVLVRFLADVCMGVYVSYMRMV